MADLKYDLAVSLLDNDERSRRKCGGSFGNTWVCFSTQSVQLELLGKTAGLVLVVPVIHVCLS